MRSSHPGIWLILKHQLFQRQGHGRADFQSLLSASFRLALGLFSGLKAVCLSCCFGQRAAQRGGQDGSAALSWWDWRIQFGPSPLPTIAPVFTEKNYFFISYSLGAREDCKEKPEITLGPFCAETSWAAPIPMLHLLIVLAPFPLPTRLRPVSGRREVTMVFTGGGVGGGEVTDFVQIGRVSLPPLSMTPDPRPRATPHTRNSDKSSPFDLQRKC